MTNLVAASAGVPVYRSQGYLTEPALFDPVHLEPISTWLAGQIASPSDEVTVVTARGLDGNPVVQRLERLHEVDETIGALAFHPDLLRIVTGLLGDRPRLVCCAARCSPARVGPAERWRQESARFSPPPRRMVSVWLALEDLAAANGALVVLPRSHGDEVAPHLWSDGDWFSDAGAPLSAASGGIPLLLPAGGAAFLHGKLFYALLANESAEPRRVLQFCYVPWHATTELAH